MWRLVFWLCSLAVGAAIALITIFLWFGAVYFVILFGPLFLIGLYDICQTKKNILRNYPIIGHMRYIMMSIRGQIHQYWVESDTDGAPYDKEMRDLIYERAHHEEGLRPFGTEFNVREPGYENVVHSLSPQKVDPTILKVKFGNELTKKPYTASIVNISSMSFGALSSRAVMALNAGAKLGGFAQWTGEGGYSPYHRKPGGDIVWQIGTGYFGCRTKEGNFCLEKFKEQATMEQVKMIEIKLSQGAKPGHGGILPAAKITKEISEIRGVPMGQDCLSPPAHTAFSTPKGLLEFVATLREASGGKPVGFKLCIGRRTDFMAICKAMLETKIYPDFITVDGGEGGTGAAPLEYVDRIGLSLTVALNFVRCCLVGAGLKEHIRLVASAKLVTGFDVVRMFALGADTVNMARAFMFSLGCVQSIRCSSNTCPTGVATQDHKRARAINVKEKSRLVKNFHEATVKSVAEVIGAMGYKDASEVSPRYVYRRVSQREVLNYMEIYDYLESGSILDRSAPEKYLRLWDEASAEKFL